MSIDIKELETNCLTYSLPMAGCVCKPLLPIHEVSFDKEEHILPVVIIDSKACNNWHSTNPYDKLASLLVNVVLLYIVRK